MTSRRSLYYYLWVLNTADRCGMKTIMLANGIGPLLREGSRRMTAKAIRRVDALTLRDEKSLLLLREIGVSRPDAIVTADPAFLLTKYTAPKTSRLPYSFGIKPGSIMLLYQSERNVEYQVVLSMSFQICVITFLKDMASRRCLFLCSMKRHLNHTPCCFTHETPFCHMGLSLHSR